MFNKSCMKEQEIRTANLIMAEGKRSHWSFQKDRCKMSKCTISSIV